MKKFIKKVIIFISLGIFIAITLNSVYAYEVLQGPTELRYWDKEKAYNGYTLFATNNKTYLIDMEGKVVHTWPMGKHPILLENGNLLDASKIILSSEYKGFQEIDWNGNVVWEYYEKSDISNSKKEKINKIYFNRL